MNERTLPAAAEMMEAFMGRDRNYDGLFFTAVHTTDIFCRPSCPARKPKPENVGFYATAKEALAAGFRPCKRCFPMTCVAAPPAALQAVLKDIDRQPGVRIRDADLRARGIHPAAARRWFKRHHGMTFHAYARARRLGAAFSAIRKGREVTAAAMDNGYEALGGFNEAFRKLLGAAPTKLSDAPVLWLRSLPTPLGLMVAGASDSGLELLEFNDRRMLERQLRTLMRRTGCKVVPGNNAILRQTETELAAYFAGKRLHFDVPLLLHGTDFQQRVWKALREIPPGSTLSYGALAKQLGQPTAVRAVARANGDNRLAIVVPCHRVIGADGSLTGYGGGLWRKQRLLELEQGL